MQATFAFSLDLADDTDHAKKLMDAILSAFITVKAAAKELGASFNTTPPAPYTNPVPASASVPSVAAVTAPAPADANAQLKDFFAEQPALADAATTAEPKAKRGRKPKVDAFAPASVANEPLQLEQQPAEAVEEVGQFEQPIDNLQDLVELGNSVCKALGPKLVAEALKKYNAGKYSQIPQDKWVEVASVWRRALNASVKA